MSSKSVLRILAVLVVLGAIAAGWSWRAGLGDLEPGAVDLVELFPDAEKRTTQTSLEAGYDIQTVTIDGDRKRSIFAHPFSRITWRVSIPPRAVLRTAAAVRPDSWDTPGDGAVFRIGVSDGSSYTEYWRQVVRPQTEPTDRRWFPVEVDLSAFSGQEVDVIFNTEPGEGGNAVSDACVWGAPRIVPGKMDAASR